MDLLLMVLVFGILTLAMPLLLVSQWCRSDLAKDATRADRHG